MVDANTLASGALSHAGSPAGAILDAWREREFVLAVSKDILSELSRTLAKPYFVARFPPEDATAFIDLLAGLAVVITVPGTVSGVASHPEDDRILECAAEAEAQVLVTGDLQLQQLVEYRSIPITPPGGDVAGPPPLPPSRSDQVKVASSDSAKMNRAPLSTFIRPKNGLGYAPQVNLRFSNNPSAIVIMIAPL